MSGVKTGVFFIAFFLGSLALPAPENHNTDFFIHVDENARILGGSEAAAGSVPYMVAMSSGSLLRSFLCGGSLISQRSVLTAAHCIDAVYSRGSLASSLRVTVGTNRWNSGGRSYTLARNVTHPNYMSSTIKNDIGILITSSNVALSNVVRIVSMSFDFIGAGVNSRVAGWGRTRTGGSLSSVLMELTKQTIDGNRCIREVAAGAVAANLRAPPVEPHIELCTFHSNGRGTCNGDSGSALVLVDGQLQIGIVSWGIPCARGVPDMFVRLSAYRNWVLQSML